MDSQPVSSSGTDVTLKELNDDPEASRTVGTGDERRLSPRGRRDRSVSEARMLTNLTLRGNHAAEKTPAISIGPSEVTNMAVTTITTVDGDLRDFCRGQPPRQSFLSEGGRTPPRFRMSRRSTLADKPELDSLLKAVMVMYKGVEFLPLNINTIHRLSQWLNGAKPLAHHCLFRRLMITSEANKVNAEHFVAALEHIGIYCEHLAIIAPFHTIEFGNIFDRGSKNPEPGTDWEKILQCFPNLHTLIFEHPAEEPTNLTRDTFYALNCALANNTTLQKIEKVQLDVPPRVLFDYHHDYHNRQRHGASPYSSSIISSPLTMVGSDMVYADGTEDFGSLDDDNFLFGKADDIHTVYG